MILFSITITFIGFNLYFANTDKSCAHITNYNTIINFAQYMLIEAYVGIVLSFNYIINLFIINIVKKETICNNFINRLNIIIYSITGTFIFCWTFVGANLFWNLIDNKLCNFDIYNYLCAKLVLQFIFILFTIIFMASTNN